MFTMTQQIFGIIFFAAMHIQYFITLMCLQIWMGCKKSSQDTILYHTNVSMIMNGNCLFLFLNLTFFAVMWYDTVDHHK